MTDALPIPSQPVRRPRADLEALDIIAFITSLLAFAIIPLTLGLISWNNARKLGLRQHPLGVVGLVFGAIQTAFWVAFFIMAAFAAVAQRTSG